MADSTAPANRLTRFTRATLRVNALLHGIASLAFAVGFLPHAAAQPQMAYRAAAAGFAGVAMMLLVATRLERDPVTIVLPLVFVLFELIATLATFALTRDPQELGPGLFESAFLVVYCWFFARVGLASRRRA